MTTDLTADLTQFAADVQQRAAALTDRIRAATPDGHLTNEFLRYLDLAATLAETAAAEISIDGLYIAEPADLDTADPDVDVLLAEYATA
jgi:hypothetical protein